MPLYELLCLSKPLMARPELAALMRQCGELLCNAGGVITGIKSYGNQELAYNIRRPFEKYGEAHIWQMNFMVPTETLPTLNHLLNVNDNVLRHVVVKRPHFKHTATDLMRMIRNQELLDAAMPDSNGTAAAAEVSDPRAGSEPLTSQGQGRSGGAASTANQIPARQQAAPDG
ncbi:MAG: hypothetical protein WDW38_008924 [Sanguina aurantia]